MAEYEVVREIQNECVRNQMRDVFFDEVETEDPVAYVRQLLKDERQLAISVADTNPDNIVIFADCAGIVQKFVFSKI